MNLMTLLDQLCITVCPFSVLWRETGQEGVIEYVVKHEGFGIRGVNRPTKQDRFKGDGCEEEVNRTDRVAQADF